MNPLHLKSGQTQSGSIKVNHTDFIPIGFDQFRVVQAKKSHELEKSPAF